MKNPLSIPLDPNLFDRLKAHCGEDEAAMQAFIVEAVEKALAGKKEKSGETKSEPSPDKPDLEDYLKKGRSGSRSYGVKGQGW